MFVCFRQREEELAKTALHGGLAANADEDDDDWDSDDEDPHQAHYKVCLLHCRGVVKWGESNFSSRF